MSEFWKNHDALKKYPLLLDAMKRADGNSKDTSEPVYMDIMSAWKRETDIFSTQFISFTSKKPAAVLGVELFDKNTGSLLQTDYINGENICLLEGLSHFADVVQKKENSSLVQKVHFMWLEPDGTVKTGDCERILEFPDEEIVERTEVYAPRARKGKQTIVLYGHESYRGENEDYSYKDNYQRDGKVRVMMPVSGEVLFHDKVEIKEICFDEENKPTLQLLFETGDAPVCYGKDCKNAFRIEGNKVYFEFDEDWGTDIDVHRFSASTKLKLHLVFRVTVLWNSIPYTLRIVVESLDTDIADTSATVIIEPISIRWGCLGKDSLIRMPDGRERPISDIRIGDWVMTPDGGSSWVVNIYCGQEENIICIGTVGGKKLLATASHPVQTKRGVVVAGELRGDDEVFTEFGEYEALSELYSQSYQDKVYNLELEQGRYFYANGIMVGDFREQNSLSVKQKAIWSEEVLKLRDSMRDLMKELK